MPGIALHTLLAPTVFSGYFTEPNSISASVGFDVPAESMCSSVNRYENNKVTQKSVEWGFEFDTVNPNMNLVLLW